ncbi:MFS transporter [Mammaliicoccus sciuri]|uniref:MFS transporter n=1 Tax=Mammaliicoccus sciuri TaxID=1296 RepID=UPI002934136E|nr:MFS transporter [Mammaliicoccus sciuri]
MNLLLFYFISSFGSEIFAFACSFYILFITHSSELFGFSLAIVAIIKTISSPIIGTISDRINNKKMILFFQIMSIFSLILFFLFYETSIFIVIIVMGIISFADGGVKLIISSNLSTILDKDIERIVSLRQMIQLFSTIIAPVIGGLLITIISIKNISLLNILTETIALLCILFLSIKSRSSDIENKSSKLLFKEGLNYLKTKKILLYFIITSMIANFLAVSIIVGIPIIAIQYFKLEAYQFGFLEMTLPLIMLLSTIVFSIKPIKQKIYISYIVSIVIQIIVMFSIGIITLLNIGTTKALIIMIIIYGILVFSISLNNIPYSIYLQREVDDKYKGRVFSINQALVNILTPAGMSLYGILFRNGNYSLVYFSVSIIMFLTLICFIKVIYNQKEIHLSN